MRPPMFKRHLLASPRPEPELAGKWGLRSTQNGRWMPVVYASEAEAEAVASAIMLAGTKAARDDDSRGCLPAGLSWG